MKKLFIWSVQLALALFTCTSAHAASANMRANDDGTVLWPPNFFTANHIPNNTDLANNYYSKADALPAMDPLSEIMSWNVPGTPQTYQNEGVRTNVLLYSGAGTSGVFNWGAWFITPNPTEECRSNLYVQIISGAGDITNFDNPPNDKIVFNVALTSLMGDAYRASGWFQKRDFPYGTVIEAGNYKFLFLKTRFAWTNGVCILLRNVVDMTTIVNPDSETGEHFTAQDGIPSVYASSCYTLCDPTVLPHWNWKFRSSTTSSETFHFDSNPDRTNLIEYLNVGGHGVQIGLLSEQNPIYQLEINPQTAQFENNWSWWLNGTSTNLDANIKRTGDEDLFHNFVYFLLGIDTAPTYGTTYDSDPGQPDSIVESYVWFGPVDAPGWSNGVVGALPCTVSNFQATFTALYYGDTDSATNWLDIKKYWVNQNSADFTTKPLLNGTHISITRDNEYWTINADTQTNAVLNTLSFGDGSGLTNLHFIKGISGTGFISTPTPNADGSTNLSITISFPAPTLAQIDNVKPRIFTNLIVAGNGIMLWTNGSTVTISNSAPNIIQTNAILNRVANGVGTDLSLSFAQIYNFLYGGTPTITPLAEAAGGLILSHTIIGKAMDSNFIISFNSSTVAQVALTNLYRIDLATTMSTNFVVPVYNQTAYGTFTNTGTGATAPSGKFWLVPNPSSPSNSFFIMVNGAALTTGQTYTLAIHVARP